MKIEKRKHDRIDKIIEGDFYDPAGSARGALMMTNYSRSGFRARFNREIVPGSTLEFEVRLPERIMPVFAKGKVIWVRGKDARLTYGFEAGIRLEEIDELNKQYIPQYRGRKLHLKQVAAYAFQRGYLARQFPEKYLTFSAVWPGIVTIYLAAGIAAALLNPSFALFFSASLCLYAAGVAGYTTIEIMRDRNIKPLSKKLKYIDLTALGRLLTHVVYGAAFLRGVFAGKAGPAA